MKYTFLLSALMMLVVFACSGGGDSSSGGDTTASTESAAPPEPEKPDGQKIYRTYCITCHGMDGKLELNGAKDLSISELPLEERITQVTEGKNLMTPFKGILTEEQIQAVSEYTMTLKQG